MKKSFIRSFIVLTFLSFALMLTGCSKPQPVAEEVLLVRSQTITGNAAAQSASYSGEVRGRYESQLAFQVAGKIVKRQVDLGSAVKVGDALMEIDPKDIQQTVNSSSAQVYSAESQLALAQSNLTRYQQLFQQGAISSAQFDQYQAAYNVAVATVRQTSAQYSQGSNQLGYSTLSATNAGVIASISAEVGQVVSAGQVVMTLVQDGQMEIEINIPENRIDELRQAQQIQVAFWALPDTISTGTVREIAPMADKVTRTYKVRISLIAPPPSIKLGMTANVTVLRANSTKSIFIPLSALYQTGTTPTVWVIENGTVHVRPLQVGAFGDNQVEVLSGLQTGDIIVTAGIHKLKEGQKVRTAGEPQ